MPNHLSDSVLMRKLEDAAKLVNVGGEYLHYKNKRYQVLDFAILEATDEICVLYRGLYGKGLTFIRPLSSWLEDVEVDGQRVKRFRPVSF